MRQFLFPGFCLMVCFGFTLAQERSKADLAFGNSDYALAYSLYLTEAETNGISDYLSGRVGRCLVRSGKTGEAKNWLETKAYKGNQDSETQLAYAELYMATGRLDKAEQILKSQLDQANVKNKNELYTLYGLTGLYSGKSYIAEEYLSKAKQLVSENKMTLEYADAANNYGLYMMGVDAGEAESTFLEVLSVYRSVLGDMHPKVINTMNNLALTYASRGNFFNAINMMNIVLDLRKKVDGASHPNTAFVYFNLAQIRKQTGNTDESLQNLAMAEKIYRDAYDNRHPDLANVLNVTGAIYLDKGEYKKALEYFQQALAANSVKFNDINIASNPSPDEPLNDMVALNSLTYKAEALYGQYIDKTLLVNDLKNGLMAIESADKIITKIRRLRTNTSDKLALSAMSTRIYGQAIMLAGKLAEVHPFNRKKYEYEAFLSFEKNRAAVLADAIAEANAKSFAGIPAEITEKEMNLKGEIAQVSRELSNNPSLTAQRDTLFALNREYEQLVVGMEKLYPEYYALKHERKLADVSSVQQKLNPDEAFLGYYFDDKNRRLYGFYIEKKSFKFFSKSDETDLQRNIRGFRNAIYFGDKKVFEESSLKLFQTLLPSIGKKIRQIIVVPDGAMSIIPFEALLTAKPTKDNYPFLLRKLAVSNVFSASLFTNKEGGKPEKIKTAFVAAPINFNDNVAALPYTEKEAGQVTSTLKASNIQTVTLTGKEADKVHVNEALSTRQDIIHLATHGFIEENHPELSKLLLAGDPAREDNCIFAGEIYTLQLKAHLVSLSACRTGLGTISQGEGIIGFSRAFTYAGAQNLLVSYWNVADQSTSLLMNWFYEEVAKRDSASYAECLRRAKLKLINDTEFKAPYYWAAFFVVGL